MYSKSDLDLKDFFSSCARDRGLAVRDLNTQNKGLQKIANQKYIRICEIYNLAIKLDDAAAGLKSMV